MEFFFYEAVLFDAMSLTQYIKFKHTHIFTLNFSTCLSHLSVVVAGSHFVCFAAPSSFVIFVVAGQASFFIIYLMLYYYTAAVILKKFQNAFYAPYSRTYADTLELTN